MIDDRGPAAIVHGSGRLAPVTAILFLRGTNMKWPGKRGPEESGTTTVAGRDGAPRTARSGSRYRTPEDPDRDGHGRGKRHAA